uniref:Gag_p10 domain-containing protein n=1 Tax=Globodera pallida TaxID=36090 RepID=A0A183CHZ2_GLOPA
MSLLYRIGITPCVIRLKHYLELAQENLANDLADQQVRAQLIAERQAISKAISVLEKFNDKWENLFLSLKGAALQEEQQHYRQFRPEGKPFMEWVDQARGVIDTIEGALGLSEDGLTALSIQLPHPAGVHVPPPPRHNVAIPPITLPKFSGEPQKWPLFWKLFKSSVESLKIEDSKKHKYLLECLPDKSVARRAIAHYPPSDENYPMVVNILKKRFGDERSLVSKLLQAKLPKKEVEKGKEGANKPPENRPKGVQSLPPARPVPPGHPLNKKVRLATGDQPGYSGGLAGGVPPPPPFALDAAFLAEAIQTINNTVQSLVTGQQLILEGLLRVGPRLEPPPPLPRLSGGNAEPLGVPSARRRRGSSTETERTSKKSRQ